MVKRTFPAQAGGDGDVRLVLEGGSIRRSGQLSDRQLLVIWRPLRDRARKLEAMTPEPSEQLNPVLDAVFDHLVEWEGLEARFESHRQGLVWWHAGQARFDLVREAQRVLARYAKAVNAACQPEQLDLFGGVS